MEAVGMGALVAVGVVVGFFLRQFLPSYFKEKGKNLATKEDVAGITREIEGVRVEYSRQLELVRASLQSRVQTLSVRYEREFEILLELSRLLVDVRDAASSLRPMADMTKPGQTEDERRKERLDTYNEVSIGLYTYAETRRPFFSEEIHAAVNRVLTVARREAIDYAFLKPEGEGFADYWDKARANAEEIQALSEEAIVAIRDRVQKWEHDDVE
jgi:hypothetical protein